MKFRMENKILLEAIKLIIARGKNPEGKEFDLNMDAMFEVKKGEILVRCIDKTKSCTTRAIIPVKVVKKEGDLPIGDLNQFSDYLETFDKDDNLTIEYNGEEVIISRTKPFEEARFPGTREDYIRSNKDIDLFPYRMDSDIEPKGIPKGFKKDKKGEEKAVRILDCVIKIDAKEIKRALLASNVIKKRTFLINVTSDSFTIRVGDSPGKIMTLPATISMPKKIITPIPKGEEPKYEILEEVNCTYSFGFGNVFGNLSGEITLFTNEYSGMWIRKETEHYTINYYIAKVKKEK